MRITRPILTVPLVATLFCAAACEPEGPKPGSSTIDAPQTDPTEQATATKTVEAAPPVASPAMFVEDPGAENPSSVTYATAVLIATEGNTVQGTVAFHALANGEGLHVETHLSGLPEGEHAYHVHLFGDCSAEDGTSAGTHFNFEGGSKHPGDVHRITGNLGVLKAGADGKATHEATLPTASLQGAHSIIGRAVIVHEKTNDESAPPIGAAGKRMGCGTIGVAESAPAQHAALDR